ncbi:MAG: hypothetical protein AAF074_01955 [Pseudomonadota bacterium]
MTFESAEPPRRLDALRAIAARSRLDPRIDLDKACGLLRACPEQAAEAYALALLRAVSAVSDRRVVMHRPGVREITFDEAWVLRVLGAIESRDWDSALFCICSRIPAGRRSTIRFLAEGLVARIDDLVGAPTSEARLEPNSANRMQDARLT